MVTLNEYEGRDDREVADSQQRLEQRLEQPERDHGRDGSEPASSSHEEMV